MPGQTLMAGAFSDGDGRQDFSCLRPRIPEPRPGASLAFGADDLSTFPESRIPTFHQLK
jgi:hypothetical protein